MMCCNKFVGRVLALALVTLLAACGGGGGSTPVLSTPEAPTAPLAANVINVTVDDGPSGTGYNVNRLYTTVTVCNPGTTQCQTIDHVLVDTGSFGVRLLASAMNSTLNLKQSTGASGLPLLNCAQFVDLSFAWGPVVKADVVLGGKTAASVPIQVIADPAFNAMTTTCVNDIKGAITTTATLGANGILGIGLFKEDCGSRCVANLRNDVYFTCTATNCNGATARLDQQVQNPVSRFLTDNNGVLIDLPRVASPGLPSLNGTLTFGIGTQSPASVTVLTADSYGYFSTVLAGQNLPNFTRSFIDSGSNGLFFDSTTITKCGTSATGFYCPTSPTTLLATLVDAKGVSSLELSFPIGNATALFADRTNSVRNNVLPTLAGPITPDSLVPVIAPLPSSSFDWGLPFFYGRRVFFGIEGMASSLGTGPFYAF